jgi:hypothetical protein
MIKIIKIFEVKKPLEIQGKDGNPYYVYSKICGIEVDEKKNKCEVKAFSQTVADSIKEGAELNAERKKYNDIISFNIKSEKKRYYDKGYSKVKYTQDEFDTLWAHAKKISNSDIQLDTYFRCATVSEIKIVKSKDTEFPDIKENSKTNDKQIEKDVDAAFDDASDGATDDASDLEVPF